MRLVESANKANNSSCPLPNFLSCGALNVKLANEKLLSKEIAAHVVSP